VQPSYFCLRARIANPLRLMLMDHLSRHQQAHLVILGIQLDEPLVTA
jgi:hypothetical protein